VQPEINRPRCRHQHLAVPASQSHRLRDAGVFVRSRLSAYIRTSDDEFSQIQEELLVRILEAAEAAGTRFALPIQAGINYNADVTRAGNGLHQADK
jgi:hypothetical protein